MKRIYLFFIAIGILGVIFVISFGLKGAYILNLAFLSYFLKNKKPDERERQLMRKVFNISFGLGMVGLVNIYILGLFINFGKFLIENWVGLFISILFILLGTIGIIVFNRE